MKDLSYKTLFQRSWHPAILPVRVSLSHVHHKVPPEDFGHDHAWLQAMQCLFLSSAASNISACSFFHFPHLTESTILSTNQGSIISSSDFLSDWLLIFPIFAHTFWKRGSMEGGAFDIPYSYPPADSTHRDQAWIKCHGSPQAYNCSLKEAPLSNKPVCHDCIQCFLLSMSWHWAGLAFCFLQSELLHLAEVKTWDSFTLTFILSGVQGKERKNCCISAFYYWDNDLQEKCQ